MSAPFPAQFTPQSIDQVLVALDDVVDWAHGVASPIGYFAAIYFGMTAQMHDEIEAGNFADPDRMARFDVIFATRYLHALWAFHQHCACTRSWRMSFEAARDRELTVVQHVLVGVNAHMRLDLPVAAASVEPREAIRAMETDFDYVNNVLATLVPCDHEVVLELSPLLARLEWFTFGENLFLDELARHIRHRAWKRALHMSRLDGPELDVVIDEWDEEVARMSDGVLDHEGPFGQLARHVWAEEEHDVALIIESLRTGVGR